MFGLFKNGSEKYNKNNNLEESSYKTNEVEEEWVWLEGYKGTDKNMKCRDFQYELNKSFKKDDKVEMCKNGLHFCLELRDVFNYYELNPNNRFFKVKGLVRKKDFDDIQDYINYRINNRIIYDSKIVAKEIIFIEELQFNDLKEYIQEKAAMVETEKEYYIYKNDYKEFCKNKFISELMNLGFSDLFSQLKYEDCLNKYNVNDKKMYKYLKTARAYKKENLNRDMMIYLLEKIQ